MASWRYLDRSLAAPLLLLNFAFYVIVMAIAGWALGSLMMQGEDVDPAPFGNAATSSSSVAIGNAATPSFVQFSLIAGAVGVASIIAARHLLKDWSRSDDGPAVTSAALMAWFLLLLAFSLACKEISIGHSDTTLKFMEAFVITLTATNALYLLVLYNGYQNI